MAVVHVFVCNTVVVDRVKCSASKSHWEDTGKHGGSVVKCACVAPDVTFG